MYASWSSCAVFFSSIRSFMIFTMLVILVSILSNLFSRFLASLHCVRTCSLSWAEFVIIPFWSILLSSLPSHPPPSSMPLLERHCDHLEKRHSDLLGFWYLFADSFSSSLVCLVLIFEAAGSWTGFLWRHLFCCWCCCCLLLSYFSCNGHAFLL